MVRHFLTLMAAWAVAAAAAAATVSVAVTDTSGKPVTDAVISLALVNSAGPQAMHTPEKAVIAQRNETFIPLVAIVRRGGNVVFTNNDTTMHQVYSFSPVKQFEFTIDQGQVSKPVSFDKTGVAAIGCNIHDQMIAYVYVADAPFAALTNASGHAELTDVAPGSYRATLWHPQLAPGRPWPTSPVTVTAAGAQVAFASVPLLAARPMKHMHMAY
jgi:plastocyanin